MSGRIGSECLGAFEGGPAGLSEIDRALALIGTADWIGTPADSISQQPRPTSVPPAANNQIGLRRLGIRFCVYVVLLVRAVTGVRTLAAARAATFWPTASRCAAGVAKTALLVQPCLTSGSGKEIEPWMVEAHQTPQHRLKAPGQDARGCS